ncbi:MAG: hypothetical protein ACRBN8_19365 [Nannocystales bacterium]
MRLYVFGNGNLSFEAFCERYVPALEQALSAEAGFVVCDFRGADTLTLEWLKTRTADVEVLHVGERPRYLPDRYRTRVSNWTITGGFASDHERDEAALQQCTHVLGHDFNSKPERISGTAKLLARADELGRSRC